MNRCFPFAILGVLLLTILFSCVDTVPVRQAHLIDSLNRMAYGDRYKNLEESYRAAREAFDNVSPFYQQGRAEACNNLGFCAFMRMDFEEAERLHKEVYELTRNEPERLIADVGLMKIYQRTALNKAYYDYRNSAIRRMKRIREERDLFVDTHETMRLNYAFSEFYIVSAIYHNYLRQRTEAIQALEQISQREALEADTAQWLYFHYIQASASLSGGDSLEQRRLNEFDELYRVRELAMQQGMLYFVGNSMQGLANLMATPAAWHFFESRRGDALRQLGLPIDSLLPFRLAQAALHRFTEYGDPYQLVGSYLCMGRYLNAHGRYAEAIDTLGKALTCVNNQHLKYCSANNDTTDRLVTAPNSRIRYPELSWMEREPLNTSPEWISRIREQLSVSYAGLGMKEASNNNRNIYLDLLNSTRQDREWESRYRALEAESKQLNWVLLTLLIGSGGMALLFWFFNKRSLVRNRKQLERLQQTLTLCRDITASIPMDSALVQQGIDRLLGEGRITLSVTPNGAAQLLPGDDLSSEEQALMQLLMPYIDWSLTNAQSVASLSDERNQLEKERYVYERHIAANKRQNLIKKACMALVNGINPYIDRILNEVHKLTERGFIDQEQIKREKYLYIEELVTTINEYNDILALWIRMKQGELSLTIENFELNELFELLAKGRRSFEMKRQQLEIEPTTLRVKADKALTLFMINTLADNARKYTPEGGTVRIYARATEAYVEISIEDNGPGFSAEDIARILHEKVYDPQRIGMKEARDPEELRSLKGSGFGLMNCKGIVEKYRKTDALFNVCTFSIESEPEQGGSRLSFRLPPAVRKTVGVALTLLLLAGAANGQPRARETDSIGTAIDPTYEQLLNRASDFANAAYFANVDGAYELALQQIDSAMLLLNQHYAKYSGSSHRRLQRIDEAPPAELSWWREGFDSDFHVILDIRNEAAVALLALKRLDEYTYNNDAYTALYKLSSEDQSIEAYCRELERSTNHKTVGLLLCILLLLAALLAYYLFYLRKRWAHRMNLEQVLEINKRIFAASGTSKQASVEALQREEDTLKEIPQQIIREAFEPINELLEINLLGLAVYNEAGQPVTHASTKCNAPIPTLVQRSFEERESRREGCLQALPLLVETAGEERCVGVLYLERREESEQEADLLLMELIARYVAIVVLNSVVKPVVKFRDIELAHEEAQRAAWEESLLHVQNLVLDNCLSTIKHETIYYPHKIKQIVGRLIAQPPTESEERERVSAISELIEYYKGVFTILSSCASRQLEEVTFRRTTLAVTDLLAAAENYFRKASKRCRSPLACEVIAPAADQWQVAGDLHQLHFLFENLIDEALRVEQAGTIRLEALLDGAYIRFLFTDTRREKGAEELNQLFYPNLARMSAGAAGELCGTEYLVCKQIIRDHDEFAGRRGCRINAEPSPQGGFRVYFTLPLR